MDIEERFLKKVDKSGDCWLWTAALFDNGYGAFWVGTNHLRAHRWAYKHFVGPIPEGAIVMHTCDVRNCVNPDHLRLGTALANQQDMTSKGRGRIGPKNGMVIHVKKLGFRRAQEIRTRYAGGGISQHVLAEEYGVSQKMISNVVRRLAWNDEQPPSQGGSEAASRL